MVAAAHPENDYLAIEVHTPGVGSLLKQIEERSISNVRIVQHDALEVLEHMIAPDSFEGAHVFFPDPWPKKRQFKRRFVSDANLARIVRVLKPGGEFRFALDQPPFQINGKPFVPAPTGQVGVGLRINL